MLELIGHFVTYLHHMLETVAISSSSAFSAYSYKMCYKEKQVRL